MSAPVASVDDLVRKYGTETIDLMVGRLVSLVPAGADASGLASELGVMMADLRCALRDHVSRARGREEDLAWVREAIDAAYPTDTHFHANSEVHGALRRLLGR